MVGEVKSGAQSCNNRAIIREAKKDYIDENACYADSGSINKVNFFHYSPFNLSVSQSTSSLVCERLHCHAQAA